jgi:hypothetical protein
VYKSYFKENFPYIKSPESENDEFSVERILSLNEEQLLQEGLVRVNGELLTEGVVGTLLGAAAKGAVKLGGAALKGAAKLGGAALKGAAKLGGAALKSAGKALIAAVKSAVVSVGKDLVDGIKKTATKYTPQLAKFSAGAYEDVFNKLSPKLSQPKGLESNTIPVVNELFNFMKPTLTKIQGNPEMNQQAWANFLGILTLDYLQKVVAPTLAGGESEPDLNLIKGLRQNFEKALLAKFQPLIKASETQKEAPKQEPVQQDLGFEPVA